MKSIKLTRSSRTYSHTLTDAVGAVDDDVTESADEHRLQRTRRGSARTLHRQPGQQRRPASGRARHRQELAM